MANESQVLSLQVEQRGRTLTYEVYGGLVLVGSGSHCDVRLLPEDAAPQQLQIELRGSEVHVRSLAPEHDCRIAGAPFAYGVLPAGAELTLGQATLRIALTQRHDRKQRGGADGWPPAVRVLGFAGIALGLYFVLQEQPQANLLEQTVDHPSLFGAPLTECSVAAGGEPEFHASRLIREAHIKGERAPFFPRDGVAAVPRFEEAASCFERLGRTAEAKMASRAASTLRAALSDELHVRHVRLERYLSIKKYDAAQREVHVLQDFLDRQDGPYAQWLAAVQRELNTRFASAKKKG